ncbi:MAG: diguanylate cyclase [Anaerolineaceae bacterium]|nr:diguanylate cyclase [Anaerolineaceae bacterium]
MKNLFNQYLLTIKETALVLFSVLQAKKFWRAYPQHAGKKKEKNIARKTANLQEETFRFLMENQSEGFVVVGQDEVILYANSFAGAILGVEQDALIGRSLADFTDTQNLAKLISETNKRLAGEKSLYELEISLPGNSKRIMLVNAAPQLDENQKYIGTLATFLDITERKQTETALQESRERYEALYLSAQRQAQELALLERVRIALAHEMELPSLYRLLVEATAETFGYTQVSLYLLRNGRLEMEHQVGYASIFPTISLDEGISGRVARTGQPVLLEDVRTDPDFIGALDNITSEVCVPVFDQDTLVGIFDIESTQGVKLTQADLNLMLALTEHIRIAIARARLYSQARSSEVSYRALASNLPGIVFRLHMGADKSAEFFNPMLKEITGYTPAEISPGKFSPLEALILLEDRNKVNRTIKTAVEANRPFEVAYRIRHKNGELRFCVERGRPVPELQEKPVHIDGVIHDLTERHQAENRLAKYARQMEALHTTSLAINAQTELPALLRNTVEQAAQMLGAHMGSLHLVMPGGNTLEQVIGYHLPTNNPGDTPHMGENLVEKVAQSGEAMFITDYSTWKERDPSLDDLHIKRLLAVPLKVKGKVIGVINIADDKIAQPFSTEDIRLVSLFADQAAIAVENARLYARLERLAIMDDLTGLFNRRGLMDLGAREVERAARFLRPLCAIFADIDHFKDLNDQYSHAVGDRVLASVAKTLKSGVREIDLVGRYGGEEFVILLVDTDLAAACEVANRLRIAVEHMAAPTSHGNLGVTVSLGVAQLHAGRHNLEAFIHRADQAMYRAKLAGRNRVMLDE